MDSILAIGAGLVLRLAVDAASDNDFRVGGSLVGLWEGVVLYHFIDKMPRSSLDPYIGYAVRLIVDLLYTEDLYRMALVVLWTGLGMVLSDIAPIFWYDTGLRHIWRRFKRDLAMLGVPALPFTTSSSRPTTRGVRFQHRSGATQVTSVPSSPSTRTTSASSTSTLRPILRTKPRTAFPGSYPDDWSTVTGTPASTSSRRLPSGPPSEVSVNTSVLPHKLGKVREHDGRSYISEGLEHDGLTERDDPSERDPGEIPEEEEVPHRRESDEIEYEEGQRTPTINQLSLSPTTRPIPDEAQPPMDQVPVIPDSFNPVLTPFAPGPQPPPKDRQQTTSMFSTGTLGEDPFEDYGDDLKLDDASMKAKKKKSKSRVSQLQEAEAGPSSAASSTGRTDSIVSQVESAYLRPERPESVISTSMTSSERLEHALVLRRQATAMEKQAQQLRVQASEARAEGRVQEAFLKKKELDELEIEISRLHGKAERRVFSANNMTSGQGEIDVSGLRPEEAVVRVEAALAELLDAETDKHVNLKIKTAQPKGRSGRGFEVKNKLRVALSEHGLNFDEDPFDSKVFIVHVPQV